jgi:hypothetical protein
MRPWGVSTWFLVVIGCSGSDPGTTATSTDAVQQCITQYAPSKGYGYADDSMNVATSPAGADAAAPSPPVSSLDQAVSNCQSGGPVMIEADSGTPVAAGEPGTDCDASRVMTRDAALCIARAGGLGEGMSGLKAGLVFHGGYRRIIWSVENTTSDDGNGSKSGESWDIDAITGAVLFRGGWSQTP